VLASIYIFTQQPTARFTLASLDSVGTADMRLSIVKFISIYRHTQLQDVPYIEVISLQDI
jgi:hypothetical protein